MKKVIKVLYLLRYYLLTILLFVIAVCAINICLLRTYYQMSWYLIIIVVVGSTLAVIALDGLTASIIHHLPKKLFDPYKKCFIVKKWEKKFFNVIKIKKWKDKIPEIGALTCDFGKDHISDPNNVEYIYSFLIETGYAEVIHNVSCVIGFLVILICPKCLLSIGLPIGIINVGFNILSSLIQRYNRPKLLAVYERKKRTITSK
jgi:glycosyl-4,4'-diaponeurosporenoate acyltransferase